MASDERAAAKAAQVASPSFRLAASGPARAFGVLGRSSGSKGRLR